MVNVTVTGRLAAPIDRVWAVISDFGGLQRWHPLVLRCSADGAGIGMCRNVEFQDWTVQEQLVELNPAATTLGYRVTQSTRASIVGARASMTLSRIDAGNTSLEWKLAVDLVGEDSAAAQTMFAELYKTRIGHLRQALGIAPEQHA